MLNLDSQLSRNNKVPWKLIEREAILINMEDAEVIQLDEVGADIWNALDDKKRISDIIEHICETFKVSNRRATKDTLAFLNRLVSLGVIRES